jgi:DNA-binding NtrC family response regulator
MVSRRVLIVDDDASVLFVLRAALQRLFNGDQIVGVKTGREALSEAREEPFDLLLTDLRMPGMDGIELTEAIKELHPDTAVIWITGFGAYKSAGEQKRLGVELCLDKPLEIKEIRAAVHHVLSGGEGASAHGAAD